MQETKIEWTDFVWNPIKGLCPVGCWYCYARRMYQRFKQDSKMHFEKDGLKIIYDLKKRKPSKIFVCSTFELFHPITNTLLFPLTDGSDITYRSMVFKIIEDCPQHTFQILTKFPQNIDCPMPDNVHLGVTITGNKDIPRVKKLLKKQATVRFVSIEPFLNPIYVLSSDFLRKLDWIILGRLTGHGKKHDPPRRWLEGFEAFVRAMNIPIFLKSNLKEIWGEPLIQEFPDD